MKTRKLCEEDRRAFDLLLDAGATAGKDTVAHVTRAVAPKRLAAAKKLLAVLDEMPEIELPTDLLTRTLARIDEGANHNHSLPEPVRLAMQYPPA